MAFKYNPLTGNLEVVNPPTVADDIKLAGLPNSTFSVIQDMINIFNSAGWISGGGITDNADGTITVAVGTGLIRATDSSTAPILFTDWPEGSGANVILADNETNYIYAEYNSGVPRVVTTITERPDFNTNILLALITRVGTTLHISEADKHQVNDHAGTSIRRFKALQQWGHVSGATVSEVGTRNIAFTAGVFWRGLTEFSTSAFDSSAAGTFSYFHSDGSGGFTEIVSQTVIDNTQFDNGTGLATLSQNKYGVHWVYLEADNDVVVVYGSGDFTLPEAKDAPLPSAVPKRVNSHGFLIAKIIIQKSAAIFISVESAFDTTFTGAVATDHGNLVGILDDDHPQYLLTTGARALTGVLSLFTNANITAATTQTQGQGILTGAINEISTVANANDVVTLKTAIAGNRVVVINNGANTLQIFPNTSDNLGSGVNNSTTLDAGKFVEFITYDATNWKRPGVLSSPLIDINTSNIFSLYEEIQKQHGGSLLMEKGLSDSFGNPNEQGADEANSTGEQHDNTLKLYKGVDGGTFNSDFTFDVESNHIQKEEILADITISGNEVTVNTGVVGPNVLVARFSVDDFANEASISARTDDTHFDLPAGHGLSGTNVAGKIRFAQFDAGVVKFSDQDFGFGLNAIPPMTSDTMPSGVASASTFESGRNPYKAMDRVSTNSVWIASATTGFLKYDFGSGNEKTIIQYTLKAGGAEFTLSPGRMTKTFKFEGSNNDADWTEIDAPTDQTAWSNNEKRTFNSFSNSTPFRYCRVDCTANNGGIDLLIDELEMMEANIANVIDEAAAVVPAFDQLKNISAVSDINFVTADETPDSQTIKYTFIFGPAGMTAYNDADTLVAIFNQTGSVWKKALNWNGSAWQRNTDTNNTTAESFTTLTGSAATDFPTALAEALDLNAALAMTGTDVGNISDAEFEAAGGFIVGTHTKYGVGVMLKSTNNLQNPQVDLIRTNLDAVRVAMVLQSKAFNPGFVAIEGYVWTLQEFSSGDGPGIIELSRDNFSTKAVVTMVQQGNPIIGNIRILRGTLDLTGLGSSGQDIRYRYTTEQGKDQFLHSVGLQARQ